MERAVYFDGWYPHTWCQHPSMPPRRLAMLDDLTDMRATTLVWAGLGGGSVSLPFLEEEAFGLVPARFRQHGYVSDGEFVTHARDRGIEVFAIVFEAQAWELAAEVDQDGTVLAQTELRDVGERTWVGLREFSQGTGPASWKPLTAYFADGLTTSAGEPVEDLFHEVASKDLDGRPYRTHWVEIAEREQICHYGDRTNPVWRAYLKRVIEIQVDAGARAIQLDETETPLGALRYGGCFCRDCMAAFREHLQALLPDDVPAELAGVDLATFDYASWLRGRGHRAGENPRTLPLYQHWSRCLQLTIPRTFADLADHARAYGTSKGVRVEVAGNFFDCAPMYDPFVDLVDRLVTEMKETRYQQPWWFRHAVGMARGTPVVAVENPYGGGIMESLVTDLERGRGRDRFRMTILEASAMGATMALPYGSWLGNEMKHSYSAPRDLAVETGRYLESVDHLLSATSPHRTAVLWSVASLMRDWIDGDQNNEGARWYPPVEQPDLPPTSYWETVEHLSRSSRAFDVVPLPDEGLRTNDVTAAGLRRYAVVVLPDVWAVSIGQHAELIAFLDAGGRAVVHGAYGLHLPAGAASRVLDHPRTVRVTAVDQIAAHVTPDVEVDLGPLGAVSLQTPPAGGVAVHLVSYDHDDEVDAVRVRHDVDVAVAVPVAASAGVGERPTVTVHTPDDGPLEVPVTRDGDVWRFVLPVLGVHAIAHLT